MKTLLIVDDELLIAEGLRDMLSEAFAGRLHVICCYSAAEALKISETACVSLLLTDIDMPDISGLELHALLRKKQPDCRVIYLTGYSDFSYARKAVDQHAFAYVLKGEGDDIVIQTIERALREVEGVTESVPETESGTQQAWLMNLQAYIHANLASNLSLTQLAEQCHFHPVYLSRAYKEATGMTITDYISQVKLDKAKQLLRGSLYSVHEISELLGFASDNYFCRWFRKNTRRSPHSFREEQRK